MGQRQFFLGVDGGGTGCRARLCDASGVRLGEGTGGAANVRLGLPACWDAVMTAVDGALAQAGLTRDALPRLSAGLGLAGICALDDIAPLRAAAPKFGAVAIAGDAHIACLGAFAGGDGAILIVGTGSIGYAILNGTVRTVGGWGFELSDEGSGADLGRQAIRAALHAYDGIGPGGALANAIIARLGGDPPSVVRWVGDARPRDYAALAPVVLDHAGQGDSLAIALLKDSAAALDTIIARLHHLGADRICPMGGLAGPITPWLSDASRALLGQSVGDAMDGALLMARKAATAIG